MMMVKKRQSGGLKESKKKTQKRVNFTLLTPEAQNVFLAGDFNDWDVHSHPLKKDSKGTWEISVDLMPGRYEYRFLVDGVWRNDPNCTTFAPNPFGGENCVIRVLGDRLVNALKLDKIILEIVRELQPISSEELWLEIGENLDLELGPSRTEINQRLEKMEKRKILVKVRLNSKEEGYTIVKNNYLMGKKL